VARDGKPVEIIDLKNDITRALPVTAITYGNAAAFNPAAK
jgi:hypothetical protein